MIYTSNYATVKNHPMGVGISRSQPKWWHGPVELDLAPATWEMVRTDDWNKFKPLFEKQLEKLDVHAFAKKYQGKILLCWENISKDRCHRELVKDWFNKNGYQCEEYEKPIVEMVEVQDSLF